MEEDLDNAEPIQLFYIIAEAIIKSAKKRPGEWLGLATLGGDFRTQVRFSDEPSMTRRILEAFSIERGIAQEIAELHRFGCLWLAPCHSRNPNKGLADFGDMWWIGSGPTDDSGFERSAALHLASEWDLVLKGCSDSDRGGYYTRVRDLAKRYRNPW